ncbi:ABC-2 type transport system permease protein [Tamaricihabitans halophyticus]|uniref:ABC-2 type transport system permease protein n=1 Tax=Tamaricihabitans halophyticus TaxID=1262583 RepID=A0A4R2QQ57_9PSEU|nr:ABC transporter permease [Tamaricihabitans halophyticus]TCP51850.1 ABC-2 type transport system permease protein [Tamaricihabitans halophyticus]
MTTTAAPARQAPETGQPKGTSFASATWLVAEREVKSFLRTKGFWIGIGVIVAALFALSILPGLFGGGQTSIAAVGTDASRTLQGSDLEVRQVADRQEAEQLVRAEQVDAAVLPDLTGQSATGVRVLALSSPPTDVIAALNTAPPVDLLETSEVDGAQSTIVVMAFSVVFMMFAMGGIAIAQSTVTEKQTRIVEILVATIPVRALLAGKILGQFLLTLGQLVIVAVAAPIALQLGGHTDLLRLIAPALGWFIPFLLVAFVLLASLWAVAGSLVSRQEDLGSSMSLVMILVLGPYFGVTFFSENETVLTVLSYVPFSAGLAMPVRMFNEQAQVWEALLSLGILAASVVLVAALATRLYSGSLLQTGGKVALSKAWRRAD